ncbi:sporulation integral membrane protein YtvI [Sinanaerobacter sp. ZZT-01]|uniref:sporulation integral membrane protein YtvI n=1 Tax=Sinanaerobacter sp. ZZT-01 TaxID=3111540 RepID=UPI002D79D84B|nr:sporulation integral membrane protein YtvI [Sinanaerobacter sp. ZZT-01]WRR94509.1 sporulation integral membrane protein YtvI [Sinanaerobacter sp. ZZT-01]
MDLRKRKRFIINAAYCSLVVGIVIVVFRYAIFWIMPFVVGFSVAFVLKPLIDRLSKMTHINRKPIAAMVLLLFYATVGLLIFLFGLQVFFSIQKFTYQIPDIYNEKMEPALISGYKSLEIWAANWDPKIMNAISEVAKDLLTQLGSLVSSLSTKMLAMISGIAVWVPGMFVSLIFTIISSFFIAMDYYKITSFIVRQFNPQHQGLILDIKDYVVSSIFKFITSYALIMSITFAELSIGLSILRIENAILVAFLISLVDVLPVLGTGGVVIPWILIELAGKNYSLAIGLLVLYLFVTVMRNILEPKIVGNRVGLHPVLMLISMFVGVKLFGALGLIILPFLLIVVKNLNDSEKIHLFK